MSKTVYLKIRQLTKTDKQDVYLSDVAEVYAEKKLLPKIKSIKLATFYRTKKDRICISSMQVISAIQQLDDTLDVNNIGESDFIIDYRKNQQPVWLSVILKIIVCIIIFIGSAYAIMAYNNDVSTIEIFEKVYRMSGVDWLMEYNVCEIAYAIGLFAGIAVFYDHFAGKKMSKAPTPIEVSMNQYVKDENQAMIDSVECMPRCVRNNYPGGNKMLIKILFIILIGLSAGGVTATGLFALISSIGLINRYADVTNTTESIMLYEEMIIFGAGIGNIWYIFELPIKLGVAGVILYGAVSGIFIGTFLICLAETVKALPILAHRVKLKKCLGFVVLFIAIGKMVGHLVYYLVP